MTAPTSAMRDALESAQKALKKLADAVFNDNGDMTISVPLMKADDCAAAYFARKKIEAALTAPAQAAAQHSIKLPEPTPDQIAYLESVSPKILGEYDPEIVIGGPQRRAPAQPDTMREALVKRLREWTYHVSSRDYDPDEDVHPSICDEGADSIEALHKLLDIYRDIFNELTAKAQPFLKAEDGRILSYVIPCGPLHRAAGKVSQQMFDGEAYLAAAIARIAELESAPAQADIHATTDDELRKIAQSIITEKRWNKMVSIDYSGLIHLMIAAMRRVAHSPTPPRVDEKEMIAMLAQACREANVGSDCIVCDMLTGPNIAPSWTVSVNAALAFGRALMEKCK